MPRGIYIRKRVGSEHWLWKGGFPGCELCNTPVSRRDYKRCNKCQFKGLHSWNWKGGLPKCQSCKVQLSSYISKYCVKHRPITVEHRRAARAAQLRRIAEGRHNNYKGGISAITRTERANVMASIEYQQWRRDVFERDDYRCFDCGQRGNYLEVHHIFPYAKYPRIRTVVENGVTLCKPCHNLR